MKFKTSIKDRVGFINAISSSEDLGDSDYLVFTDS